MYAYQALFFKYFVLVLVSVAKITSTHAIEPLSDSQLQSNFTSIQNQKIHLCTIKVKQTHNKYTCKQDNSHNKSTHFKSVSNHKNNNNSLFEQVNNTDTSVIHKSIDKHDTESFQILTQLQDDSDLSHLLLEITSTDSPKISNALNDNDMSSNKVSIIPRVNNENVLRSALSGRNGINKLTVSPLSGYSYRSVYGGINHGVDIEIPNITSNTTEFLIKKSD